ncbi:unnamed protein product [Chrysoparadoxa australica]
MRFAWNVVLSLLFAHVAFAFTSLAGSCLCRNPQKGRSGVGDSKHHAADRICLRSGLEGPEEGHEEAGAGVSWEVAKDEGEEDWESYVEDDETVFGEEELEQLTPEDFAPRGMDLPWDDDWLGGSEPERSLDDILTERSLRFYDTTEREKAFVVGLEARNPGDGIAHADRFTLEESMTELIDLAATAGLEVSGNTYQRVTEPNPRTYIGTGKVKEIKRAMASLDCKTVIIDHELSPGQQRNLEVEFGGEQAGIKVLDRTALILDIFAQHARSSEGKMQVELALNLYRLPRLTKLWSHLERQRGGGVGLRGMGETQRNVDRRLLRERISDLERQLKKVGKHRDLHQKRRGRLGLPVIALVGYTNSGKSTLLNSLTRAGVIAEDMLFATLDPTTRKVKLPALQVNPEVLVTDTVGFIQKLPTNLIAAFRATLSSVVDADVLIHVVDISNPAWEKQSTAVMQVLNELDVSEKPMVTIYNKMDLMDPTTKEQLMRSAREKKLTVTTSAKLGEGMEGVVTVIGEALSGLLLPFECVLPFEQGALLNKIHTTGRCDEEEYLPHGTRVSGRVPVELYNRLKPYMEASRAAGDCGGGAGPSEKRKLTEEETWKSLGRGRHNATKGAKKIKKMQ